jgi:hypothetical protein
MNNENILMNINENVVNTSGINETQYNNYNELEFILKEINDSSLDLNFNEDSFIITKSLDYHLNYNVKELMLICNYYGLLKEVKNNKLKKQEIILFLLDFEENTDNSLIVYKRKQLWYFMEELKNDKFMKKYIMW